MTWESRNDPWLGGHGATIARGRALTTLLVASGGGHLRQMLALKPRLDVAGPFLWAVPPSALALDYLRGQPFQPIPNVTSRDWRGAVRLTPQARQLMLREGVTRVVSTGAAPAPPFFLAGYALGLELHFIESATRSNGPSLSGQLVAQLPSVNLYTQYRHWADHRWQYCGSIFDGFQVVPAQPPARIRRVVVTFGTEQYGFRRAIERLLRLLPGDAEVLWQTGATDTTGLPIDAVEGVPGHTLNAAIRDADLVVCHAGTGSALSAFDAGKRPLLLPREARFGEHVDDHQLLTARTLTQLGLAVAPRLADLSQEHVRQCLNTAIVSSPNVPPLRLRGRRKRLWGPGARPGKVSAAAQFAELPQGG